MKRKKDLYRRKRRLTRLLFGLKPGYRLWTSTGEVLTLKKIQKAIEEILKK